MSWADVANKNPVKKVSTEVYYKKELRFIDMKRVRCKKEYIFTPEMLYNDKIDNPVFDELSDYFIENDIYNPLVQLTNAGEIHNFFNPFIDNLSSVDMSVFYESESSEEDY